jgi:hypothetical protein
MGSKLRGAMAGMKGKRVTLVALWAQLENEWRRLMWTSVEGGEVGEILHKVSRIASRLPASAVRTCCIWSAHFPNV